MCGFCVWFVLLLGLLVCWLVFLVEEGLCWLVWEDCSGCVNLVEVFVYDVEFCLVMLCLLNLGYSVLVWWLCLEVELLVGSIW